MSFFLAKFRRPRKNKMAGELSDHYHEVKEEKKPIVNKIRLTVYVDSCLVLPWMMLTGWSLATQIRLSAQ